MCETVPGLFLPIAPTGMKLRGDGVKENLSFFLFFFKAENLEWILNQRWEVIHWNYRGGGVEMLENSKQIRMQYKAMSDIVNAMSVVIDWPKQVAAATGVKRE